MLAMLLEWPGRLKKQGLSREALKTRQEYRMESGNGRGRDRNRRLPRDENLASRECNRASKVRDEEAVSIRG
jgi:hypothetical protein